MKPEQLCARQWGYGLIFLLLLNNGQRQKRKGIQGSLMFLQPWATQKTWLKFRNDHCPVPGACIHLYTGHLTGLCPSRREAE